MPTIHPLVLGDYQVNCYIVSPEGGSHCCVIDPGYSSEVILSKLSQLGLQLDAVLLTHGHFDHVGAVRDLVAATDCRVYLNPLECAMPPQLTAGKLYYTDELSDGMTFTAAGLPFSVLHTPGHTPGSVCLITGDTLFSGDTLFAGSCGRTDLPGGSPQAMAASLKRFASLGGNYWILPGHGEATSLSDEKKYNPYLRRFL